MSRSTNKILYYVRDHETTKRFFDPRLIIIPGGYLLVMILLSPDIYAIRGFLYILVIEWLIVYGIIVLEKIQTIINQQETIITLLEKRGYDQA
ncbi:MAG: hypothetical protein ACFFB5_23225 [Promethearchaeota archaeon]